MAGTHLDWTLGVETRLDYIVAHTSLEEQIAQLTNSAPAIPELGIPEYAGIAYMRACVCVYACVAGLLAWWPGTTPHSTCTRGG